MVCGIIAHEQDAEKIGQVFIPVRFLRVQLIALWSAGDRESGESGESGDEWRSRLTHEAKVTQFGGKGRYNSNVENGGRV